MDTVKTIIECGANNGSSTDELLKMFGGNVVIYAIEPTYELVEKFLYPKYFKDSRVKIFQCAIDIENSFKKFNVASKMVGAADWGCSSLYEFNEDIHEKWPNRPDFESTHSYLVPTMTLWNFCELYNIKEIDYLWIDTQGNDFNVLLSLGDKINTVKEGRCEVSENVELYKNSNNKRIDVQNWLKSKNFEIQLNYGHYESDLIFTKKNENCCLLFRVY